MVGRYSCMSDFGFGGPVRRGAERGRARGCADRHRGKRMTFEELWNQVEGLPDTAKLQVPGTLSQDTKRKLARKTPVEIEKIVAEAIEEVNRGSIKPLDELISKRL